MTSDQQETAALAHEIGQQLREFAAQVLPGLAGEVGDIIAQSDRDFQRIEHCLDHLLQYCYDEKILSLFKQLCRYYFPLNPAGTAVQIDAYREMWDSPDDGLMEAGDE